MDKITDDILESYLDGSLTADETAAIEKLLNADIGLRERLAFIRKVEQAASTAMDIHAPSHLSASIMHSVSTHGNSLPYTVSNSRPPLYAFLGIIVSLVGIALLTPANSTSNDSSSLSSYWGWIVRQFDSFVVPFKSISQGFGSINLGDTSILPIAGIIAILMLLDVLVLRPLHKKY